MMVSVIVVCLVYLLGGKVNVGRLEGAQSWVGGLGGWFYGMRLDSARGSNGCVIIRLVLCIVRVSVHILLRFFGASSF